MTKRSLESFHVYIVSNPNSPEKGLGKARPYLLLRDKPSRTETRGYLMAPLTSQKPDAPEHVFVSYESGCGYALMDDLRTIPGRWIRAPKGRLECWAEIDVKEVFLRLIQG